MFFSWIYRHAYLYPLAKAGSLFGRQMRHGHETVHGHDHAVDLASGELPDPRSFEQIDAAATNLGNEYRGVGVAVGLLGVLIVFCALAPIGFELGHTATLAVTLVKIVLMAFTVCLVVRTNRKGLRGKWIAARIKAEMLRYQFLRVAIQRLAAAPRDQEARSRLVDELNRLFDDQIDYNEKRARSYHSIEHISDRIGWIGFGAAIAAACLHLFLHDSWLVFPTAFVPVLVGAIHAINGFLRFADLAEEHTAVAKRLRETRSRLADCSLLPDKVLELAKATYQILSSRDTQWIVTARKLGLKVG